MSKLEEYEAFLRRKVKLAQEFGFAIEAGEVNPALKPHQAAIVRWMVSGGRRACFASFGLGKSIIQLETVRLTLAKTGGRGLIVCPLGVRQEFVRDAEKILAWPTPPKFIRSIEEAAETGIYITNYETIREGKLDPRQFTVVSLDEAAVLAGMGSSKTFRECMRLMAGDAGPAAKMRGVSANGSVPYRFVATATPSPNEYIELLAYADFLGVMDVSQAKTRFFKRDSTKADVLTIHVHKQREFWLWVASWALFVERPSDLGFDDTGYDLPPLEVVWHEVATDHRHAGYERSGQGKMFRDSAIGVQDAAAEKRSSLTTRVAKVAALVEDLRELDGSLSDQPVLWCDLNDEQTAIERALNAAGVSHSSLTGVDGIDARELLLADWREKRTCAFLSKPAMYGAGVNLQQSHTMIFVGIGFKFRDLIQAIHRIHRFLQIHRCTVHLIFTEAERGVRKALEKKWKQHTHMLTEMTNIIKEFGLSQAAMAQTLVRKMGAERVEITGDNYRLVNNDNVPETMAMADNSVHLILTSIPFSTQYEYSPNFADFGHSDGNDEFFEQMDFLTPELLRVLQPGRIAAIHVKDRIVPGGLTGLGFQAVYPFHVETIKHYTKHGFAYMGMKTIVTDVVRENNQTYRLGWSEQCKDATKMGVGMPEYLLLFRKPPTSAEKSYSDTPAKKAKPDVYERDEKGEETGQVVPWRQNCRQVVGTGYSRSRWQIDAHAFTRSAGERLLTPEELKNLSHKDIFRLFRKYSMERVYDFEHHVKIGEALESTGRLPVTFMLLQPQSWSDEVWTDITRMLTLNGAQSAKGKEMHLCPMQFDLADRVISQFTMEGEIVYDPFAGLMTVPYRAIKLRRFGIGCELSPPYFVDGASYCRAAAEEMAMPSLFDVADLEPAGIPAEIEPEVSSVL